jgi:hypothetical protein
MVTLGIDLSALSFVELQQLMSAARARGESDLVGGIQAELRARGGLPSRHRALAFRIDGPPQIMEEADDEIASDVQSPAAGRAARAATIVAGAAAAALLAIGVGWQVTRTAAPPAPAARAPVAPSLPSVVQTPMAVPAPGPTPQVEAAATAAKPVHAVARRKIPREGLDCSVTRARVDRWVCASPSLSAQHRQMRAAYERALAAGASRLAVDRGQARWRSIRAHAASRSELSNLYIQRIRTLNAAARAAHKRRG